MVDVSFMLRLTQPYRKEGKKSKDKDERRNQRMWEMVKMVERVFK